MLDIAEGRRYLSKKRGALAVREPGAPEAEATLVPFDEIESVIVHTPEASFSSGAIAELSRRGIPLVCCDTAHMPVSWLWPARANYEQTRRMAAQAAMPEALRDALWARLVRAKIEAQADLLRELGEPADGLPELARGVLPGDPGAAESQAARLYWLRLFEGFRRERAGDPPNGLLNYGYAVLRATVARQLCAAGLHPSLGLHHRNRFNAFCLADDLMEPFRPAIDRAAAALWRSGEAEVSPATKPALVAAMTDELTTDRGAAPLSRCVEWAAQSLARSVMEGEDRLRLPRTGADAP